ncbi:MAG: UpxY family transcription antiterminator [Taibaiella sp.]|nr:UpxY family transcription antiterminator [Taibaiella sp.]
MPWYVLYTKPRNEKKVAKLLGEKCMEVYCPVQEVLKQWSDRKKKVIVPVFTSYLFVYLEDFETENVKVLRTAGVVRFLWWLKKPAIVRPEEIKLIKDFLSKYKGIEVQTTITEGQHVTVTEGTLKENKGKVLRIKGAMATLHLYSLGWNLIAQIPVQSLQNQPLP